MSCRINFKHGDGTHVIDRTFPGTLSGKMSEGEWTAFCNRIDVAMEPIGALIKSVRRETCIYAATFLTLCGIATMFWIRGTTYLASFTFFSSFLATVFFHRHTRQMIKHRSRQIEEDIVVILNDETNQRSDVSFHLRDPNTEQAHIECSVSATTAGNGTRTGDTSVMEQGFGLQQQIEMPTAAATFVGSSAEPAPAPPLTAPSTSIFSSLAGLYAAGAGTTGIGGASTAQRLQ